MNDTCSNKSYFGIFIVLLICVLIYKYAYDHIQMQNIDGQTKNIIQHESQPVIVPIQRDIITEYDYRNLNDPLQEPGRRSSRFDMINIVSNPYINIPSRGYPDTFSVQGYLVDEHCDVNDPNRIIRLFGRQWYPTSSEWQYYVEINVGNDKLKTDLCRNKREIFDGDVIHVSLIKKNYVAKLLKNKTLEYNPMLLI